MDESKQVYIGTDSGATMSKVGGVWADGTTISTKLHQRPTNSQQGRAAVVAGWIAGVDEYLRQNELSWDQVSSVGLAIPGPVPALRRARALGEPARQLRGLGRSHRVQPGAGRRRPGARCRWSSATTARSAASARRSACAARHGRRADAGAGLGPRLGVHRRATACRWRATRWPAWRPPTCRRRCTCWARSRIRAAAAARGAASSCTRRWRACRTCWPRGWPTIPTTRWRSRPPRPRRRR